MGRGVSESMALMYSGVWMNMHKYGCRYSTKLVSRMVRYCPRIMYRRIVNGGVFTYVCKLPSDL